MSEKKARLRRKLGLDTEGPGPNFTDLPDTREQRRKKQFRPRAYARELEQTSPILHSANLRRWRRALGMFIMNRKGNQ